MLLIIQLKNWQIIEPGFLLKVGFYIKDLVFGIKNVHEANPKICLKFSWNHKKVPWLSEEFLVIKSVFIMMTLFFSIIFVMAVWILSNLFHSEAEIEAGENMI